MATKNIPPTAKLSLEAVLRNDIYTDALPRLQHLAWRALYVHGLTNIEFVVVCIQVDSIWRDLVDATMPNHDWQAIRDIGEEPMARGTVNWAICSVVAERLPDITDVLLETPSDGKVKAIVLTNGGGTVYELEPKQQR